MLDQFVAIRMIVVNPDKDKEEFKEWMIDASDGKTPFVKTMGDAFVGNELKEIIFLEGNKEDARQSYQGAGTGQKDSTPAGANADFAWITRWTSKSANETAWSDRPDQPRPANWKAEWKKFLDWCHPRRLSGTGNPNRPEHGPPYDFYGAPGQGSRQYGRGVGCLVEGFVVIARWWPEGYEWAEGFGLAKE